MIEINEPPVDPEDARSMRPVSFPELDRTARLHPTQVLEPVPSGEKQAENAKKSPLENKIDAIREKAKTARDDGKKADLEKIEAASGAIEDRAKKIVAGAGTRAEAVSHAYHTVVHMHAGRVVQEGWARTEHFANRSFDALKNVGRIAIRGAKFTAVLGALPVVGVGAAVDQTAHGLKELGVGTAKKFLDARTGVRELSVRGKAAKEAAVSAFRMVAPTQEQTLLTAYVDQLHAARQFRDENYKKTKAELVARRPITRFVAQIRDIIK